MTTTVPNWAYGILTTTGNNDDYIGDNYNNSGDYFNIEQKYNINTNNDNNKNKNSNNDYDTDNNNSNNNDNNR